MVYGRVPTMFWVIFNHTNTKISLHRVVFRVEFDGDIRFCVAPPKSTFLLTFLDFVEVFHAFLVLSVFAKLQIFVFRCRRRQTENGAAAPAAAAATAAAVAICQGSFAHGRTSWGALRVGTAYDDSFFCFFIPLFLFC